MTSVLGPARRRVVELSWAVDFYKIDSGVVPVETSKVVASGS